MAQERGEKSMNQGERERLKKQEFANYLMKSFKGTILVIDALQQNVPIGKQMKLGRQGMYQMIVSGK